MAAFFDLKVGESLSIEGGRIVVTMKKKSGQLARLMVDAPTNVRVEVESTGAAAQAIKGIKLHARVAI